MFDQTFFSQNKTFKFAWREKPLFQTPSFLISYIFNVVQAQKYICCLQAAALQYCNSKILLDFNISSSFTVQNLHTRLVKIDHVCFGFLATTILLSVLQSITHKKRALYKNSRSEHQNKCIYKEDKASKLKKISMNYCINNRNNMLKFYCQR